MSVTVFPTPAGASSQTQKIDIINSTQAWVAPVGVTRVDVVLVGGGGGGGGASGTSQNGGGGGGGGVLMRTLAVTPGTSYTITIGAGGASGGNNNATAGGHGSNSTFGSLMTSHGGGGGQSAGNSWPTVDTLVASGGGRGVGSASRNAGSGGGANASYYIHDQNAANLSFQGYTAVGITLNQGSMGLLDNTQAYPGNIGIDGYGGGGGGADPRSHLTAPGRIAGGVNAGLGANTQAAGTSGVANCGGGGGGNLVDSGSVYRAGGAGGSGVCIIRYWS